MLLEFWSHTGFRLIQVPFLLQFYIDVNQNPIPHILYGLMNVIAGYLWNYYFWDTLGQDYGTKVGSRRISFSS